MVNFYEEDANLQEIMKEHLSSEFFKWADQELRHFGSRCAGAIDRRAAHTDRKGQPELIRYDKMGNEVSQVWLNEGYQQTVKETYGSGIVGYVHKDIPELGHKGNYVYSYAQNYLLSHAEPGFDCPVALTMATAYLIDHYASEELKEAYLPHVLATGDVELYEGATFLTERQGGSDVGANEVEAVKEGDYYRIHGEKYFASNAGACGVAMVLARLDGAPEGTKGLSLFLVPWEENRAENQLRIRRLKDKLGVRAVPSAEVEFTGAKGYLVGKENQGFYYMIEALNLSRVSNMVSSLGIMRRAYLEARNYASDREAFGNRLTRYPMIQETLTLLAAKQEIEMHAVFDVVTLMDKVMGPPDKEEVPSDKERILFRLYVATLKVETAKQAIAFSHEAIEMHGGNGYIEDFVTPRLLRDAQVLNVWEGTENILALEVLRLIGKYNVEQIFAEDMRNRLEAVQVEQGDEANVAAWIDVVDHKITQLLERIATMKTATEDMQTYYSRKIAKQITDILESVTAVEKLASNKGRMQAISEVFLQHRWNKNDFQETPAALSNFDLIVNS